MVVNSDLIKFVENAPDTVITLVNGEKVVVRETTDQVLARVIEFRRSVLEGLSLSGANLNIAANPGVSKRTTLHAEHLSEDDDRG
jgi:flagellar protein FlbD